MFRSCWPSLGIKMHDFKNTRNKTGNIYIYIYNVTLKTRPCNHCCSGKAVTISLHILSVFMQPWETSMQCACSTSSFVSCPALQYFFPTWSHKRHDFRKKNLLNIMRFYLQLLSEFFFILRRILRDIIKMYIGLYVKHSSFPLDCSKTWNFSTDFRKSIPISNFMKIRPLGAELFQADCRSDGRTDRHDEAMIH